MLVLTRKNGEALRIGPDVRIRVLSTSRGQVRLGVEAPGELLVLRDELYERVVAANREAANSPAGPGPQASVSAAESGGPEAALEESS